MMSTLTKYKINYLILVVVGEMLRLEIHVNKPVIANRPLLFIIQCVLLNNFMRLPGCIGHETGGAQYQAGLLRGFHPWAIMSVGLSSNIMLNSLIRSQWLNGLAELPSNVRRSYYEAIAQGVRAHYGLSHDKQVPMSLNNFHAGNWFLNLNYHKMTQRWNNHHKIIQLRKC